MRSDYIHTIENFSGRDVLVIEDLNLGGKSVTNNIETVIGEIEIMEKIDATNYMIVYKDSDGVFDGYDFLKEEFIPLQADEWKGAVQKYAGSQLTRSIAPSESLSK